MKKSQPAGRQGFTLIELLMYIGLLTIFLTVLTEIFVSILDVQLESESTSHVTQDGRYIMARLLYDVSRATAIITPGAIGGAGSTLQLTIGGTTYTYGLSGGGNLTLTDGTGSVNLNGYDTIVSNVLFTRLGNPGGKNTVTANFTIGSRVSRPQGTESMPYQVSVGLR